MPEKKEKKAGKELSVKKKKVAEKPVKVALQAIEPQESLTYTTVHGRKIRTLVEEPTGILTVVDVEGSIYKLPPTDAEAALR